MKNISFLMCFFLLFLLACSNMVPVWTDVKKLKDNALEWSNPLEFQFEMSEAKTASYRLDLDLTYYKQITRDKLPIVISIENLKDNSVRDYACSITLNVDGIWQGKQTGMGHDDYLLASSPLSAVKLEKGKYRLRIFANDEHEKKIYGISQIALRWFENKEGGVDKPTSIRSGKDTTRVKK